MKKISELPDAIKIGYMDIKNPIKLEFFCKENSKLMKILVCDFKISQQYSVNVKVLDNLDEDDASSVIKNPFLCLSCNGQGVVDLGIGGAEEECDDCNGEGFINESYGVDPINQYVIDKKDFNENQIKKVVKIGIFSMDILFEKGKQQSLYFEASYFADGKQKSIWNSCSGYFK